MVHPARSAWLAVDIKTPAKPRGDRGGREYRERIGIKADVTTDEANQVVRLDQRSRCAAFSSSVQRRVQPTEQYQQRHHAAFDLFPALVTWPVAIGHGDERQVRHDE